MRTNIAPIALFVFNRPSHTKKTLDALASNVFAQDSELYIFADGPKEEASDAMLQKMEEVRKLCQEETRFKKIYLKFQNQNIGLANSILNGVSEVLDKHETIIVLEDDIVTGKYFLEFMNKGLNKYKSVPEVMSLGGHSFEVDQTKMKNSSYFLPYITCWGWATWKKDWLNFNPEVPDYEILKTNGRLSYRFDMNESYPYTRMLFDQMETNKVDSWCIRWYWNVFNKKGLTLYPDAALIHNIGFGEESTHTKGEVYKIHFNPEYRVLNFPDKIAVNKERFAWIKSNIKKSINYLSPRERKRLEAKTLIERIKFKLQEIYLKF